MDVYNDSLTISDLEEGLDPDSSMGSSAKFSSPLKVVGVCTTEIDSVLADACKDQENHLPPSRLSFVSRVRQLSIDSLIEFAQPFLNQHPATSSENILIDDVSHGDQSNIVGHSDFGPVVENYYDNLEKAREGTCRSRVEIEGAIDVLKERILASSSATSNTDDSRHAEMVGELILLRLRLQELEDPDEKTGATLSMGHEFHRSPMFRGANKLAEHCQVCGQLMIFTPSQMECIKCAYISHQRCIDAVSRHCVAEQVEQKAEFIMDICPENGLDQQNFGCGECRKPFPMDNVNVWDTHIRLCQYNGKYYCTICHRNDTEITPANVIKNWDFTPRLVCRASKQLITLLFFHPILPVLEINKEILVQVEELQLVEDLRSRLAILKRIMIDCSQGPQIALLHLLATNRKHLMVKNGLYSLNDLVDIERGILSKELTSFSGELQKHVKLTCPSCVNLGQICGICGNVEEKLYAFDEGTRVCEKCGTVMHKTCVSRSSGCPNCHGTPERLDQKTELLP